MQCLDNEILGHQMLALAAAGCWLGGFSLPGEPSFSAEVSSPPPSLLTRVSAEESGRIHRNVRPTSKGYPQTATASRLPDRLRADLSAECRPFVNEWKMFPVSSASASFADLILRRVSRNPAVKPLVPCRVPHVWDKYESSGEKRQSWLFSVVKGKRTSLSPPWLLWQMPGGRALRWSVRDDVSYKHRCSFQQRRPSAAPPVECSPNPSQDSAQLSREAVVVTSTNHPIPIHGLPPLSCVSLASYLTSLFEEHPLSKRGK